MCQGRKDPVSPLHKTNGLSGSGNDEIQHEYQCEIKYPDPRSLQKAEELQSKHQLEHKGSSNKQTDVADEKLWLWRETESDCCKESHGKVSHQPVEPSQSTETTLQDQGGETTPDRGTWFRAMGATTTLMVPTTIGSLLAKKLKVILSSTSGLRGTSCKVVAKPGPAFLSGITVNNPFLPDDCRRTKCPLTSAGVCCREKCGQEGVLYKAVCTRCPEDPGFQQYIGETSRTIFVRRQQHLADYRLCSRRPQPQTPWHQMEDKKSSFMWDHQMDVHQGSSAIHPETDFAFTVVTSFKDPLTRQIAEAVKIQRALDHGTF